MSFCLKRDPRSQMPWALSRLLRCVTVVAISRSCSQQCKEYEPPSGQIFTIYEPLSWVISEDPHCGVRRAQFIAPFHRDEN